MKRKAHFGKLLRMITSCAVLIALVLSMLCSIVPAIAGSVGTTNEADGSKIEWVNLFLADGGYCGRWE